MLDEPAIGHDCSKEEPDEHKEDNQSQGHNEKVEFWMAQDKRPVIKDRRQKPTGKLWFALTHCTLYLMSE